MLLDNYGIDSEGSLVMDEEIQRKLKDRWDEHEEEMKRVYQKIFLDHGMPSSGESTEEE